jgi:hypothetical protein
MERAMDRQFSVQWRNTDRNIGGQETDWSHPPPSGFGRLLLAAAIIGIVVCLLDHAGKGPAATCIASAYGSSQQWR